MGRGTALTKSAWWRGPDPAATVRDDGISSLINRLEHLDRRQANNLDTALLQESIPSFIVTRSIAHVVGNAIDLHAEFGGGTVKVEYIGSGWVLAAKLQTVRRLAQNSPKQDFGQRHLPPQLARLGDRRDGCLPCHCPSTIRFANGPPPHPASRDREDYTSPACSSASSTAFLAASLHGVSGRRRSSVSQSWTRVRAYLTGPGEASSNIA